MTTNGLLVALAWTTASVVVCDRQQPSSTSLVSLLKKEGFNVHCVSRALSQCQRDINPQIASAADIQNLTEEVQHLGSKINNLQNSVEALPLQDLVQTLQNFSLTLPATSETLRPRHCRDLQDSGDSGSGVRLVFPYACCPNWGVRVFCDQDTDGGGWTVVQRRDDLPPYEDFYRTWIEFARGFGELNGQFWLGLDTLHHLTSHSLQELRIDLVDIDNVSRWAKYGYFHVEDSDAKYTMHCGRYNGDAGDCLSPHSGYKFSTYDQDNDIDEKNCAQVYKGAWWYKDYKSARSNPNGQYLKGKTDSWEGIYWYAWRKSDSLLRVEIKIRPKYDFENSGAY